MDAKKIFEKYYSRLALEGFLKALILGLIFGFAAEFIVAFATWMASYNGLWISIAAGVAVAAGMTALFYFKKFRPTAKQIAKRVDRLGLEERLITMTELEGDDSYIALRQREDAQKKMREVEAKEIKLRLSKLAIAFATTNEEGVILPYYTTITVNFSSKDRLIFSYSFAILTNQN